MKDMDKYNYTPAARFSKGCKWSNWEDVLQQTDPWLFERDAAPSVFEMLVKLREASIKEDGIQQEDLVDLQGLMSRMSILSPLMITLLSDCHSQWWISIPH